MPNKSVLVYLHNIHLPCRQYSYCSCSDIRLRQLNRNVKQTSWRLSLSHFHSMELLVPGQNFRNDRRQRRDQLKRFEKRLFNNFLNWSIHLWYSFCRLHLQNLHWKLFDRGKFAYYSFGHIASRLEGHLHSFGLWKCLIFHFFLEKSQSVFWYFQRSSLKHPLLFVLYGVSFYGFGNFVNWNKQAQLFLGIDKIPEADKQL